MRTYKTFVPRKEMGEITRKGDQKLDGKKDLRKMSSLSLSSKETFVMVLYQE